MTATQPIEVKKDGLRQVQDGTWKLSLTVHPEDMPTSLMQAPMGTRYGMALIEIGDDEMPVQKQRQPAQSRAERARRLCGVHQFQDWLFEFTFGNNVERDPDPYRDASIRIKKICKVKSKSELDPPDGNATGYAPAEAWDKLVSEFRQATGKETEQR